MDTTTARVAIAVTIQTFTEDNRSWVNGTFSNMTNMTHEDNEDDYIYDRIEVQVIFIALYTIVFCSCFVGNALVILVVTLHWRMRSITNFCLANLAIADFSVGIFCVYQNLSTYLITSLSHTASILILVVICIERYLAIIHPIRCKQMLTLNRLRLTIALVWILSGVYSSPRLYYINTVTIERHDGETEILCIPTRTLYDSVIFDLISMILLFIIPLLVLTVLYFKIGVVLWRSSQNRMPTSSASESSSSSYVESQKMTLPSTQQQLQHSKQNSSCSTVITFPCWSCTKCFKYLKRFCCGGHGHGHSHHGRKSSHCRKRGGSFNSQSLRHDLNDTPIQTTTTVTPCTNDICNHCHQTIQLQLVQNHRDSEGQNHYTNHVSTSLNSSNDTPSSPYSLKERRNGGNGGVQLPKIVIEDPIIVVKFEKKSSFRRNSKKRNRCTILMNAPNISSNTDTTNDKTNESTQLFNGSHHHHSFNQHPHNHHHPLECSECCSLNETNGCACCGNKKQDAILLSNGTCTDHGEGSPLSCDVASVNCYDSESYPTTPVTTEAGQQVGTLCKLKRLRVIRSSKYGTKALQSRRRIIKMLIVVVLAFAICNLPFHARKMWQNWSNSYDGGSTFSSLLTPLTFLIMYANSGVSPVIYFFMSTTFRASLRDLLNCKMRRSLRISRRASGRSTHVNPMSTA